MTHRQLRRLRARLRGIVLASGTALLLFLATFLFLVWGSVTSGGGSLLFILAALVMLALMWFLLIGARHHWENAWFDLKNGVVQSVTGAVSAEQREVRDANGTRVYHTLVVGFQQFRVSREVFEAFLSGGTHTFYLAPRTQMILSVEPTPTNTQSVDPDHFLRFSL